MDEHYACVHTFPDIPVPPPIAHHASAPWPPVQVGRGTLRLPPAGSASHCNAQQVSAHLWQLVGSDPSGNAHYTIKVHDKVQNQTYSYAQSWTATLDLNLIISPAGVDDLVDHDFSLHALRQRAQQAPDDAEVAVLELGLDRGCCQVGWELTLLTVPAGHLACATAPYSC